MAPPILASIPPFSGLTAEALNRLESGASAVRLEPSEILFREGDPADSLFILIEGSIDLLSGRSGERASLLARSRAGECVGELALAVLLGAGAGRLRSATARARDTTRLLALGPDDLRELAGEPELRDLFRRILEQRLREFRKRFQELFGDLPLEAVVDLFTRAERTFLPVGASLFERGDAAEAVWVVDEGRLEALIEGAGGIHRAAEIGRGGAVGEIALLTGDARSATVRATRDTWLYRLGAADFGAILSRHPEATRGVTRKLARRFARGAGRAPDPVAPSVFVLVPAAEGIPLRRMADGLAERVGRPAAVLDEAAFAAVVPAGTTDEAELHRRFGGWLTDHDNRHDLVLLLAGGTLDRWTRFCLGQGDRVVLVARVGDDPRPVDLERALEAGEIPGHSGVDRLVLLHPAGTRRGSGTRPWLDARPGVPHHHVAEGSEEDLARLGRFLTGRAVGVALGGGAARCFFHLGALAALRELEVPIDALGGTSSGAHVAAAYASGLNDAEAVARIERVLLHQNPLGVPTLPVVALHHAARTVAIAEEVCEGREIEDLWLPFVCVSANLTTLRPVHHTRGSLARALLATAALPVVMPPLLEKGEVLVDGGLVLNLPVGPVRALGAGRVLGSKVSSRSSLEADPDLDQCPSGFELLLRRLAPGRRVRVPGIVQIAYHSLACAAALQENLPEREPDLLLDLPVDGFAMTDFSRHAEMIEIGRRYTLEQADALRALAEG